MRLLNIDEQSKISGGTASITNTGAILVTGSYSTMNINGVVFSGQGIIYDDYTGYIYFDLSKGDSSYYHAANNNLFTVTAVTDGYLYTTEENYQHNF